MPATTIDDIITSLENIIAKSITDNSRLGYFATLYLKVTKSVKDGIATGQFQDGPRMEKLDVIFASRYIDAYNKYIAKQPTTSSWAIAFAQTERSSILCLQHLLLGMNAHINLDLGIAAVEVCGDEPLSVLRADFYAINNIISALTNEVLYDLGQISPLLSLLGMHASQSNSALIQFSIDNARDGAWCFADNMYNAKKEGYGQLITDRDVTINRLGGSLVQGTGFLMKFTLFMVHLFEKKRPSVVIGILNNYQKTKIVINK